MVKLIHEEGLSIAQAAKKAEVPYDNAKAINRTYLKEKRVIKINYRQRYHRNKRKSNIKNVISHIEIGGNP